MNLYEVTQSVIQLAEMLCNGEIEEQAYKDTVESLGAENVAQDVVKAIRNFEAEEKALSEEIETLRTKKSQVQNRVKYLEKLLADYLQATKQTKIQAGVFKVRKGTSKSVEVIDSQAIDGKYLISQEPKIDKKQILSDLKQGVEISGVQLKENEYIVIK